jgi:hypothetical protein
MNTIIDIYNQAPLGMMFLMAVFYMVSLYIVVKLLSMWYSKNLEKNVEAFREGYCRRIAELENKLKEYERTHRTLV